MNNPPTEGSLGVPIYPGAVLNVDYTAGMSMDGDFYYVYLTMDSIEEVVSFYEDKLNRKASSGEFGYLIALKGKMPVPDEAITIQDNLIIMGEGETVITIHKSIDILPACSLTLTNEDSLKELARLSND